MGRKLDRPAAPYLQIAEEIRERIRTGDLRPGDEVPSVRGVAKEYGVAHATAYKAIGVLQSEGYIRSTIGARSVVTTEEERGWSAAARLERSRRTGKIYPEGQHAKIVDAGMAVAPTHVAAVFGAPAGSKLVKRSRITYRGDEPISRSTSWFPAEFAATAPLLLQSERIIEGTFAYVAAATGRQLGSWLDQYDPALASPDDAATLDIAEGTPVFYGRNWVYDEGGGVLEYGESVSAGRIAYSGAMTD
ncbi:GntR family transcriptional regulator [Jiangella aurantiaca]|uniref:GntR family transcriptional regulator n=1 Tax=Jiangella aurantiaca TaxID=2530373 RepID=A0A4R5ADE5_9ACTN|nr:GntR family transcriptional regulator [Jiangella aurantiaca]TDD69286.1 GntR family transcriptional regulator [Jiangella aurantiaca]